MEPSTAVTPSSDPAHWVMFGLAALLIPIELTLWSTVSLTSTLKVALTGYLGLTWGKENGFSALWRKGDQNKAGLRTTMILILATLVITSVNAGITLTYFRNTDLSASHWGQILSTPWKGLLCSLRAGITEEVPFRLFVGALVLWLLNSSAKTKNRAWWLAPLLTTLLFCLIMHPTTPMAYASSLLLSVIYYRHGIIPAILVHAFIDAAWQVSVPLLGLI